MSLLTRWAGRYGWRLLAVPVLLVITVWVVLPFHARRGSHSTSAAAEAVSSPAPPGTATVSPSSSRTAAGKVAAGNESARASAARRAAPAPPPPSTYVRKTAAAPTSNPAYGQLIVARGDTGGRTCASNTAVRHVFVSVGFQHAWMCARRQLVRDTAVTTGAPAKHNSTPLGSWFVQAKQADRDLGGAGYSYRVRYWVPYDGDFGFHDAAWQKMPFGASGYTTLGSHGCVHVPTAQMTWLYNWLTVGSQITIAA